MRPAGRVRSLTVGLALAALAGCINVTTGPRATPLTVPVQAERVASSAKSRAIMQPAYATKPVDAVNALKPYRVAPLPEAAPKVVPAGLVFATESAPPAELPDIVQVSGQVDPPLVEALRAFAAKQPEQANLFLIRFDKPNQELLAALLPLAVRIGDGSLRNADPDELAAVVDKLAALAAALRDRAALQVPKMCFCRPLPAPARFGSYELLGDNPTFRPGEMVAVYLELRNFSCQPNHGDYQTQVGVSVEVLDADGRVALRFDKSQTDPSLSPRLDYSNVVRFTLPELPPGTYALALKASDVPTGRTARRRLEFRVTAKDAGGGS